MSFTLDSRPFEDTTSAVSPDGSFQPVSFWHETTDVTPGPPLDQTRDCDVAVVGGGFTGLSTARELKLRAPELDVVLLEREVVGYGASGRNGGFVMPLIGWDLGHVVDRLGHERAKQTYSIMYDAVEFVRRTIEEHDLACDMERTGYLLLSTCGPREERLRREYDLAAEFGFEHRWLEGSKLDDHIRSSHFLSGVYDPDPFVVNPARLARGLKTVVEEQGVDLYERTPLVSLEEGDPLRLSTPRGEVRADRVVMAVNGYAEALGFRRSRQIPVHTFITLTEPLTDSRLEEIGWARHRTSLETSRNFIHYFRLTADNRILFGGEDATMYPGGSFRDRDSAIASRLRGRFRTYFPSLSDVSFTHSWGGVLGVTLDMFPQFGVTGPRDAVYYAGGYSGHGVALSNYAGRILAPRILEDLGRDPGSGEVPDPFFYGHAPLPLPPDPFRYAGMQLYRAGLKILDRWDGA